ncbi:MAG: ATP-dependent Clp protease ATP-binding subunit ClpX [Lachnospiraceae bacterium]|nr:ATP-dependent Clp protease ATP-binding subunit ClpX [Lachnospiraceae bacterium]
MRDHFDETDEVFFDEETDVNFEEDFEEGGEQKSFEERRKARHKNQDGEEFAVSEDDFEEEFDTELVDPAEEEEFDENFDENFDEEDADMYGYEESSADDYEEDDYEEAAEDEDEGETQTDEGEDDEYESVCFVCRRPESKSGKQFRLPIGIFVCNDCMHKTMDAVSQFDYQGMLDPNMFHSFQMNIPNMGSTDDKDQPFDLEKLRSQFPNVSFVNISDLQGDGGIPNKQKPRKKKKSAKPVLDFKQLKAPHEIKAKLDEYIIGQEHAKKVISVAVYNHYKRVSTGTMDEIEIEKSNMLMIGPTGCGKTYLVKTLARILDVPLAIADATSLTEAGYIGDDIESVVSKLLAAADNDVERAQTGIIFIDEIDKIAKKKNTTSRDVSGESVQQGMLKLLEGADVEVPVGANSKNAMVPLTTINTRNILFICGGAFPDLEDIIKERLNKKSSIGYQADLRDKYDKDKDILKKVTVEDLKKFGMIPEFIGRLPIIYALQALTKEMYIKILKEPKNAIIKQYEKLLELDEVKLVFDDEALDSIACKAMEKDTGARALRAIIEDIMLDIMYEIPKDKNIGRVTITKDYIEGTGGPIIDIRGAEDFA